MRWLLLIVCLNFLTTSIYAASLRHVRSVEADWTLNEEWPTGKRQSQYENTETDPLPPAQDEPKIEETPIEPKAPEEPKIEIVSPGNNEQYQGQRQSQYENTEPIKEEPQPEEPLVPEEAPVVPEEQAPEPEMQPKDDQKYQGQARQADYENKEPQTLPQDQPEPLPEAPLPEPAPEETEIKTEPEPETPYNGQARQSKDESYVPEEVAQDQPEEPKPEIQPTAPEHVIESGPTTTDEMPEPIPLITEENRYNPDEKPDQTRQSQPDYIEKPLPEEPIPQEPTETLPEEPLPMDTPRMETDIEPENYEIDQKATLNKREAQFEAEGEREVEIDHASSSSAGSMIRAGAMPMVDMDSDEVLEDVEGEKMDNMAMDEDMPMIVDDVTMEDVMMPQEDASMDDDMVRQNGVMDGSDIFVPEEDPEDEDDVLPPQEDNGDDVLPPQNDGEDIIVPPEVGDNPPEAIVPPEIPAQSGDNTKPDTAANEAQNRQAVEPSDEDEDSESTSIEGENPDQPAVEETPAQTAEEEAPAQPAAGAVTNASEPVQVASEAQNRQAGMFSQSEESESTSDEEIHQKDEEKSAQEEGNNETQQTQEQNTNTNSSQQIPNFPISNLPIRSSVDIASSDSVRQTGENVDGVPTADTDPEITVINLDPIVIPVDQPTQTEDVPAENVDAAPADDNEEFPIVDDDATADNENTDSVDDAVGVPVVDETNLARRKRSFEMFAFIPDHNDMHVARFAEEYGASYQGQPEVQPLPEPEPTPIEPLPETPAQDQPKSDSYRKKRGFNHVQPVYDFGQGVDINFADLPYHFLNFGGDRGGYGHGHHKDRSSSEENFDKYPTYKKQDSYEKYDKPSYYEKPKPAYNPVYKKHSSEYDFKPAHHGHKNFRNGFRPHFGYYGVVRPFHIPSWYKPSPFRDIFQGRMDYDHKPSFHHDKSSSSSSEEFDSPKPFKHFKSKSSEEHRHYDRPEKPYYDKVQHYDRPERPYYDKVKHYKHFDDEDFDKFQRYRVKHKKQHYGNKDYDPFDYYRHNKVVY